jgi:hypothetical protein
MFPHYHDLQLLYCNMIIVGLNLVCFSTHWKADDYKNPADLVDGARWGDASETPHMLATSITRRDVSGQPR